MFTASHAETLRKMIDGYSRLDGGTKKWLQVALEQMQRSKRQGASEGKLLDLGIAAEMLLLKDQTESDPIALRSA